MVATEHTQQRLRRWYLANRDTHLAKTKERHGRKRDAIRIFVTEYLAMHPCVDCGEADPIVLDFDHIGEKSFSISRATARLTTIERVATEIAQCVVRCANCHRRKTYRTLGYRSRHTGSTVGKSPAPAGGDAQP